MVVSLWKFNHLKDRKGKRKLFTKNPGLKISYQPYTWDEFFLAEHFIDQEAILKARDALMQHLPIPSATHMNQSDMLDFLLLYRGIHMACPVRSISLRGRIPHICNRFRASDREPHVAWLCACMAAECSVRQATGGQGRWGAGFSFQSQLALGSVTVTWNCTVSQELLSSTCGLHINSSGGCEQLN